MTEQQCRHCNHDAAFVRGSRPNYESGGRSIRVVDLFAGCGGLSLGVAEAGRRAGLSLDIRLAADSQPDAYATYRRNFPAARVELKKVEELFDGRGRSALSPTERTIQRQVGALDWLVGGPPCQGNSSLNNHTRGSDKRNVLYGLMARAARVLSPKAVFIENVPAVVHDSKGIVDLVYEDLDDAGYAIADATVHLEDLGVPQLRKRHVLLAIRSDLGIDAENVLDALNVCCQHVPRTVRWAMADLVRIEPNSHFDMPGVANALNASRIDWLFEHKQYDLPNSQRPPCHRGDHSYIAMYGRLRWDKPAQTVTTGFTSMGQGRYVHPGRRRTITPHEAARLQMLPDFFDFDSARSRGSLTQLIGNAVPPPLPMTVVSAVLREITRSTAARNIGDLAPKEIKVDRTTLALAGRSA